LGLQEQTKSQGPVLNVFIFLSNIIEGSSAPDPLELLLLAHVYEELSHKSLVLGFLNCAWSFQKKGFKKVLSKGWCHPSYLSNNWL